MSGALVKLVDFLLARLAEEELSWNELSRSR
jgi:hypothetical protein